MSEEQGAGGRWMKESDAGEESRRAASPYMVGGGTEITPHRENQTAPSPDGMKERFTSV